MRWQATGGGSILAVLRPRVVLRSRQRACLDGPLGLLWVLPRRLAALFIQAQQVHASASLARLRGEMFRLHVLARRLSDEDPGRGGTGALSSLSRADFGNSAG